MAKKITQATFDDVVRENMEEFGSSREDAVKDAVEQFTSQGVDLSTIVTDIGHGEGDVQHPVMETLSYIEEHIDQDDLSHHLLTFKSECDIDLPRRCLAGQKAFNVLVVVSERRNDNLLLSIEALCALCNGQPDVLTHDAIKHFINLVTNSQDKVLIAKVVKLIRLTCLKHEGNRQSYVRFDVIPTLMTLLRTYSADVEIVLEVSVALRTLTLDDDMRVPFGKAHDHAKMIVAEDNALKTILEISQIHSSDPTVVGELYATLGKLSVRDEFCQEILDLGGVELILKSFERSMDHQVIVKQILGVLKALAGNDKVKVTLANNGGLYLILTCMQKHVKQAVISELACAALCMLVLRQPRACQLAIEAGAPQAIVQAMQIHPQHEGVQKQACMTTRNLVARTREYIPIFKELGIEYLINAALERHQSCNDEARAALRDLDCKVELRELWKGEKGELAH